MIQRVNFRKNLRDALNKDTSFAMSVMISPGATQFTRILSLAHSTARLLVSWFIPAACVQIKTVHYHKQKNFITYAVRSTPKKLSISFVVARNRYFDEKNTLQHFFIWLSKYNHLNSIVHFSLAKDRKRELLAL
jgi:hypothetical protein